MQSTEPSRPVGAIGYNVLCADMQPGTQSCKNRGFSVGIDLRAPQCSLRWVRARLQPASAEAECVRCHFDTTASVFEAHMRPARGPIRLDAVCTVVCPPHRRSLPVCPGGTSQTVTRSPQTMLQTVAFRIHHTRAISTSSNGRKRNRSVLAASAFNARARAENFTPELPSVVQCARPRRHVYVTLNILIFDETPFSTLVRSIRSGRGR
jgi:hypothetical protein